MTSEFQKTTARNCYASQGSEPMGQDLDATKRDRFELLSAYLDGEVTADERRQVNRWLANDPNMQCLHRRLLRLRQGIEYLPVPPQNTCVETTIQSVLGRIQRRFRLTLVAGAGTVALICLGTMSGFFDSRPGIFRFAQVQPGSSANGAVLEVALDEPVIEIPKTTVSPGSLKGDSFNIQ